VRRVPVLTDLPSFRAMTADGRYGVLFQVGDDIGSARSVLASDGRLQRCGRKCVPTLRAT